MPNGGNRTDLAATSACSGVSMWGRSVALASPSEEISKATALRDSGTISADEFERIKTKALV
jgi:hypothetical protein